jgi:hypothetical protein
MTPAVEVFRWFARRYSQAVRKQERMGAQGAREQIDEAIGNVQEIGNEFGECFMLLRRPEGMGAPR